MYVCLWRRCRAATGVRMELLCTWLLYIIESTIMSLPTKAWYSVAVSDEKEHNSTTVIAILPKVIPQLQKLVARYLNYHMFTTGPTAVHLNTRTEQCFPCPMELLWGGARQRVLRQNWWDCKRMADNAVKRKFVIQDANNFFFAWAIYILVSKEECVQKTTHGCQLRYHEFVKSQDHTEWLHQMAVCWEEIGHIWERCPYTLRLQQHPYQGECIFHETMVKLTTTQHLQEHRCRV